MASEHNGTGRGGTGQGGANPGAAGPGSSGPGGMAGEGGASRVGSPESSLRGDAGAAYPQAWSEDPARGTWRGDGDGTRDWSSGQRSSAYGRSGGMMGSVSEAGSSAWRMVSARPWLATALGGLGLWLIMGRRRHDYMPHAEDLRSYGEMVGDYAGRARSYLGRGVPSATAGGTMSQGYEMARSTVSREPLAAVLGAGILVWMAASWLMRDD